MHTRACTQLIELQHQRSDAIGQLIDFHCQNLRGYDEAKKKVASVSDDTRLTSMDSDERMTLVSVISSLSVAELRLTIPSCSNGELAKDYFPVAREFMSARETYGP